ncbi:MAG: M48 family peptidase [Dehalococcoidia bacterium]|nr:M48 family peptidase [Dehalococcoidia bacterium]MSQ17898.1 M48 family peptidase [Dehalococcoidia bacterium]
MPELLHGQTRIAYQVVVSKRRTTIGIVVGPDQRVVVRTPGRVSARHLEQVVRSKAPWILKQLAAIAAREALHPAPKELVSGECFPYLGESYPLEVSLAGVAKAQARLEAQGLVVWLPQDINDTDPAQQQTHVRTALEAWYLARAREVLPVRVAAFGGLVGKQPAKVSVRSPQHRWGSCSAQGNISLNWRIVMAPLPVVDYVAAHEVCHLQVLNHSAAFWQLLGTVMPGYPAHREWLKANGQGLAL